MKKTKAFKGAAITKLVIWSVVLCILVGIFASFMTFNNIGFDFIGGFSLFSCYVYSDADEYNIGNRYYSEEIKEIDIEWIAGSVTLKIHEGSEIMIEESYSGENKDDQMRTRIDDGTLYVKYSASGIKIADNIPSKALVIYLPLRFAVTQLDEIQIETVSADVFIRSSEHTISCHSLDIETVSGKIISDRINALYVDADSVSGNLTFNGSFNELSVSTVSGHVSASLDNKVPIVRISTVSGSIDIAVPSDSGFKAAFDSASGEMRFKTENVGKLYRHGDGGSNFDFDTVSGDVNITLK